MAAGGTDDNFLARWSRRKEQVRSGAPVMAGPVAAPAVAMPVAPAIPAASVATPLPAEPVSTEPPPTLDDVKALTRDSDYARFIAGGVDESVKRAAMKKLFSDPHFNVMDGLDTYIDDYGKADPIPLAMLRKMNQSTVLRLFDDDDAAAEPVAPAVGATTASDAVMVAPATATPSPSDDDADLRLQQDDAAGRPEPGQGPRA